MVMLRPTSDMKDSGIEWVGPIPEYWKVVKNNRLFRITKTLVGTEWENTQLLSLTKGGIIEKDINDGGGKQPESFSTYQFVQKNDIVLCLFDIDVSAVFSDKSSFDGMISPAYRVMKCSKSILPAYAKWWFDAVNIGRYYLIYTKSLRKTIDSEGFGNILTAIPPLEEQQAIASYLDDRCSKLDEIIAEAEKSIEEYKELKQAVIFEAVTKGLDKKVPMSPSNVGWIDTIPSSWNVGKLRLLAEFYNGDRSSRYPSGDDIQSEGIIFVTSNNLGGIKLNVDIATNKFITQEKYNELGGAKLQIDDIVFCLRGSVGKCSINKIFDAGTIASSLVVIRPKKINPDYLNYVLQTSRITDEAIVSAIGIGSANLAAHDISEFFVPVPSEREQQEIANFLDVRIGDMDALISEKMSLIEDLQAYKKSLIYEVVTGKRRVV